MKKNPRKTTESARQPEHAVHKNNTAEYCRAKAQALVQTAIETPMGIERSLLERSAAAWSMRAEQLHRGELRLAAELPEPGFEVDHVRL